MEVNIDHIIDIKEEDIARLNNGKVLNELLTDHSKRQVVRAQSGHENDEAFIIWATDDYYKDYHEEAGDLEAGISQDSFKFDQPILPSLVTGARRELIMPRVLKDKVKQVSRSKEKAEVFTPSWVCNNQNNLVDEAWFGRKDVFNTEYVGAEGEHAWIPTEGNISFDGTGKTWQDYVRDTRLEITCGEAPYLVSRYDATTGEAIPLPQRIGLLDRKMRVINENVTTLAEWKKWAKVAYKNIYGFEWQGDNLLLAREALFYTLLDYYEDIQTRLGLPPKKMHHSTMQSFAYIISWNIWQMDGLSFVIPHSCTDVKVCVNQKEIDRAKNAAGDCPLFPDETVPVPKPVYELQPCPGCSTGNPTRHTGFYAKIRNWQVHDSKHKGNAESSDNENCDIPFVDLVKKDTE